MASGRSNKPLFELLREDTGAGMFGRRASATFSELKPGDSGRARSAYVTVPRTWVYFGVAIVLGLIAGAWVIAYRSGHASAEKELAGSLVGGARTDQPKVNEPDNVTKPLERPTGVTPPAPKVASKPTGAQPPKPEPKGEPKPESKPEAKPRPEAPKPEAGKKAEEGLLITLPVDDPAKPFLTSKGAVDADPRQPRLNYFRLVGGVPRDEARTMIVYLSSNGLETVGVPMNVVDRTGRVVNNQPLFKIVCLGGVTKQQYEQKDPARANIEQAVASLSERWLRDTKSRWSFAKPYWELLQGP